MTGRPLISRRRSSNCLAATVSDTRPISPIPPQATASIRGRPACCPRSRDDDGGCPDNPFKVWRRVCASARTASPTALCCRPNDNKKGKRHVRNQRPRNVTHLAAHADMGTCPYRHRRDRGDDVRLEETRVAARQTRRTILRPRVPLGIALLLSRFAVRKRPICRSRLGAERRAGGL